MLSDVLELLRCIAEREIEHIKTQTMDLIDRVQELQDARNKLLVIAY